MNTIEIKNSKTKLILLSLGCVLFIILGLILAINPEKMTSTIFRNVIFIRIAGIVALLFFIFCLIILIKGLFIEKFSLIINEKGIIDNSSFISVGMIPWDDITSVKSINVMSNKFLLIHVKNPNNFLNNHSGIKKKILQRTLKTYDTPISISSNTLAYNFDELEKIILKFYNEYKNN